MSTHKLPRAAAAVLGLGLLLPAALPGAEVAVKNTAELRQALREARPGALILLAAGVYEGGLYVDRVQGANDRPIVVAAADTQRPPVFRGSGQAFHLSDCAHLELRDLVVEKTSTNGMNIDDGGSFDTPARHIVLRNIVVRDAGTDGNHDGIKLSGLDDFRIEGCTVERWGRGGSAIDMVGCHRGVIERCTFRDREPGGAANAVQTKGGTHAVTIRRCLFEHAGQRAVNIGGSTGLAYFRPAPQGFEAKDIVVEGCTFIGSEAPVAFVGVDGATVRFNTIYRPRAWILRILQETRAPGFVPCRNGCFTDNLIVYRASDIRTPVNIGPGTAPDTFVFARNF
ncbi:MAG TPA: hypothetical protein DCM87_01380, partial [Planctomycetes bacterium]|nr:hypothetical protein [Planctomycetota bacterium]